MCYITIPTFILKINHSGGNKYATIHGSFMGNNNRLTNNRSNPAITSVFEGQPMNQPPKKQGFKLQSKQGAPFWGVLGIHPEKVRCKCGSQNQVMKTAKPKAAIAIRGNPWRPIGSFGPDLGCLHTLDGSEIRLYTPQGANISHLGERKIIFKMSFFLGIC